ncbi:MAG: AMP-binding protein [Candidatus Heimdallarchaeota archaeon]|nr:MAG: AMP-binding protein [Candidatus Heimdallarchaeota archaeon]
MSQEPFFWKKNWDEGVKDLDPRIWETTYPQAIRDTFETLTDNLALEYLGIEITFGELDRYSNQFAHMLIEEGFQVGDRIGINLPNIPQFVIALLGALKAGCVVTGVSFLLSEDQLLYQLNDAEAKGIVTLDAIFEKRLLNIAPQLPNLKLYVCTSIGGFLPKIKQVLGKLLGKIPIGNVVPLSGKTVIDFMDILKTNRYPTILPENTLTPDDIAYVLYTGGTTGPPKGAMLTHRNIMSNIFMVMKWLNWEKGSGSALSGFPFFHIAGLFFCENCIILGWPQLLVPNPRDTDHICKLMKKYQPTCVVNVPSLFQMLLENPKFKELDHSKLDTCISAAAPFPVESQRELESIVGKEKLLEVYGMTETSPLTTMNPYLGVKKLGTIGLPIMNTDIKLVEPSTGDEIKLGEPGEICVKGPQVMKGYWNNPEATKQTIDENGYIHTGDVAIMDEDGYLRIVDRIKDMIIVSGFKVFSTKLEDTLTQHPAINMVATIGIPNPDRPGSELVKAYITLSPNFEFDGNKDRLTKTIIEWAKEKVSPYEVPKIIEIREELPLTTVGKVDKILLRKE